MPLKNFSLSTIAGLTLGLLLVGYTVLAWSVPSQPAPNNNVPAPLNTSPTAQTKAGDLTLQGDVVSENKTIWGDDVTLGKDTSKGITECGDLKLNDNSASPIQKVAFHACDAIVGSFRGIVALFDNSGTQQIALDPQGRTIGVGTVTVKGDGSISPGLNSSKLQDLDAASLMAAGGGGATGSGGGTLVMWGSAAHTNSTYPIWGESAPSCPVSYTEAYAGYGPYVFLGSSGNSNSTGATSLAINTCGLNMGQYGNGSWGTISACATSGSTYACNTCRTCVPQTGNGVVASGSTLIYATVNNYNGGLGGRSGVDSICATALPPALSGKVTNIHAFLSLVNSDEVRDMTGNDSDRDGVANNYYDSLASVYAYNRDWGMFTVIASSWFDLLDDSIKAPTSNTAVNVINDNYWTGSYTNGSYRNSCNGWTSATGGIGSVGNSSSVSGLWVSYSDYGCTSEYPFLCAARYTP